MEYFSGSLSNLKMNFMTQVFVTTLLAVICFLIGCRKNEVRHQEEMDTFSFVYNGQTYQSTIRNNTTDAAATKSHGKISVSIDMENVFHGRIYFEEGNCAFFAPWFTNIQKGQDCQLFIINPVGSPEPVDSSEVYLYQSGTLNASASNCETRAGTDFVTGYPYSITMYAIKGTFDLILVNKNGQTIQITNGIFNLHHVVVY